MSKILDLIKAKPNRYYFIALAVVLVDQAVKLLVKLNMEMNQEIHVIGDFFKIHFIENNGAAFGLTIANIIPGLSEYSAKLILTIFSFFAVFFIIYILKKASEYPSSLPIFVSLILGGAIGNIIDRMFYGSIFTGINEYEGGLLFGRVVDMFYVDLWQGFIPNWMPFFGGEWYAFWPIFNIADAAISIGIVTIFIFQKKFFNEPTENEGSNPKNTDEGKPEEISDKSTEEAEPNKENENLKSETVAGAPTETVPDKND